MKRSLALLAAFVIASGYQSLSGETSGDWTYTVTDNQATITSYSGDGGEVVIPSELDGVAVVKVDGGSYKSIFDPSSSSVTSVTIPDSVTSIGNAAFYGCTNLTNFTIPDSVTSIGAGAFDSCTSLISVTILDGVTTIGYSAFISCTSLTSVTVGNSVESIGSDAFGYCTSLTSVTLPGTLFMEGNYTDYSLSANQVRAEKTSIDAFVANAKTAARTAGQIDVTSDPATYSLYTSGELVTAALTARALEKSDIINNPTIHGLFGENTVEDVRIGMPMMRKNSEGKLLFNFQIQASDDLQNWTTLDSPEYEVIPSSDKEFLRVRVSNE